MVVEEAGNRLQLYAPTMVTTPLTYLTFARLFRKNKESRSRARALLACSSDCCFTPRRSHHRQSFSEQVCCDEVLLFRALDSMRQTVAPLQLRNLLIGHTGEASLRPVGNKCILIPIEVIGIMIPIRHLKSIYQFQKSLLHHLWHTEKQKLTCCK